MLWKEYFIPNSVEEALEILCGYQGQARIIAGGTDLVIQTQDGTCQCDAVVDITRIPGLNTIALEGDYIILGANVTHAQAAASSLIRERAGVLATACAAVGSPQIRNVGTVVGNVVNALPAADAAVALFALDAEAEVKSPDSRCWLPIADLYEGVGQCCVDSCAQMVTALRFCPLNEGQGWGFQRLTRRQAVVLPMLVVAAVVAVQDGICREARIAVGPVAPTPFRAEEAEAALKGQPANEKHFKEAAALAAKAARPRDSLLRGSAEYRTEIVGVLVRRALSQAVSG